MQFGVEMRIKQAELLGEGELLSWKGLNRRDFGEAKEEKPSEE